MVCNGIVSSFRLSISLLIYLVNNQNREHQNHKQ